MERLVMQYLERVIRCIADTTRYPTELLTPESDLENDLGIDSVKRLEITIAIGKEFAIPVEHQTREPWVRTIQDVATWVSQISAKPSIPVATSTTPNVPTHNVEQARVADSGNNNLGIDSTPKKPQEESINLPSPSNRTSHSLPTIDEMNLRFDLPNLPPPPRFAEHASPVLPSSTVINAGTTLNAKPRVQQTNFSPAGSAHSVPKQHAVNSEASGAGSSPFTHSGKIAFVTGSGHGVGNVIARLLAKQGMTVIVNTFHSRDKGEQTVEEIRRAGGSAYHLWGSVANPAQVDSMFDQIQRAFGKLDYLICNASDGKIGSFLELQSEDWDRAFRTNVSGHYQCAIRASSLMQAAGGGRIVTLSSVGSHSYIRGLGSQGVVKAAVETLTRYLACELGPRGIRVNCVAGGPVYGDLLNKFPDAPNAQQHWETMSPDGELCNPTDLANTILFLLSESARGINGAVVQVDHGFSAVADGRSTRTVPGAVYNNSQYSLPSSLIV